ncbi:glycine--tRNA ligase subunit beta [Bacillus fonticola]|uniref:glycine--tRNA ligase subunit beta n=1 Tax=Bacillus fonticola TaxID=2728853 RepID=UPI00147305C4|nr:glycine--tRNA ligase subunit beta [Bacillus fonticola]
MSKGTVLFEIGLEEMPARFITDAMEQLAKAVETWFQEHRLHFERITPYSTPRRLAVIVHGVEERQADQEEEVKGPAKNIALDSGGNWSKAAIGFSRGQGASPDDIFFKEIKGVEYCFLVKKEVGKLAKDLLSSWDSLVTKVQFPKTMRWGSTSFRYIRPLQWLTLLWNDEIVPIAVAGVESGRSSFGHRFLGEKVNISTAGVYPTTMLRQYVVASASKRKSAIRDQLQKLSEERDWIIEEDEELLEEVTQLVEYPTVLAGTFEESFLSLPDDVLTTMMREHQRYFPVRSSEGELLPFFVTVRNGDHQHLDTVAKGNEKVLKARLSDAKFFYEEDQKRTIEEANDTLSRIVYHEKMGTMAEKVQHVATLTGRLADLVSVSAEEKQKAVRAAKISKFDLVTNLVGEFPELQGGMGHLYALQKGENELVARAIEEQYWPKSAKASLPTTDVSRLVAIAEKMDTIVSCFHAGLIPSGSQDPYGLRRQAWGVLRILRDQQWSISIQQLVKEALIKLEANTQSDLHSTIISFFKQRLEFMLQEEQVRYDCIAAAVDSTNHIVHERYKVALLLEKERDGASFKPAMESLIRVQNLASKYQSSERVQTSLFENDSEQALYDAVTSLSGRWNDLNVTEKYELLCSLQPTIDTFFDGTMVMVENEEVKKNRLALLHLVASVTASFAGVRHLQVKQTDDLGASLTVRKQ